MCFLLNQIELFMNDLIHLQPYIRHTLSKVY